MTKKTVWMIMIIVMAALAAMANSGNQEGMQIAIENEKANNGFKGEVQETEMVLINAQGDQTFRKMTSQTMETKKDGDQSIITFLWPADVKGTRMLTHSHKKRDDDQWLFLPSLKRVKRISSRNKSGAFMGSEFAYEDLGSQEVEKYHHTWLKDTDLDGRLCWLMQRVPVSKKSGYSKMILWVDKEYRQPLKMEYYDRKGELLKVAVFKDYKKLDNWWRVHEITMKNVQTRKTSVIRWTTRKLTAKFSGHQFDWEALSEG